MNAVSASKLSTLSSPPFVEKLFRSTPWAWLWLAARLYVGYEWLSSGIGKLSNPGWVQTGAILKGFWTRAVAIPEAPGRPLIAFDWYRAFIQSLLDSGSEVWFSKLVVAGELLVGIALILGIFTAFAAFVGGFMNWNFMMAGTASANPVLLVLSILILLAWRVAGHWGLDRFVIPLVGTPWQPGRLFQKNKK